MEKRIDGFLHLVDFALHGEYVPHGKQKNSCDFSELDYKEVYTMAKVNNLAPILYSTVMEKLQLDTTDETIKEWKANAAYHTIRQSLVCEELKKVLKGAKERSLEFVLFKGLVLADLYPQYKLRSSSDTDIFVYEDQSKEAVQLLLDLGYEKQEEGSKEEVPVFYSPKSKHKIELHYSIYEDYKGSKIEVFEKMNLVDKSTLIQLDVCNGIRVTTLGYTEHLIYQIFHIAKHFSVEGVGVRYITDIVLYVNQYYTSIHWEEFWENISLVNYDTFVQYIFSIGIHYFQLNENVLEGRKILEIEKLEPLILDLIACGEVVKKKNASWQILGTMTPYFAGDAAVSDSKLIQRIRIIFPTISLLSKDYSYAKRYKILLPIAWFHRWIKFGIRRVKARKDWYSSSEKIRIAEHRLSLMKMLDLTKK